VDHRFTAAASGTGISTQYGSAPSIDINTDAFPDLSMMIM